MNIWQRIMSWFSFHVRRHDEDDAQRAAFLREDRIRRHALANELQAIQSDVDEQAMRLNQLRAEQNALFGLNLGDRDSTEHRDRGDAGHAGV